MAFLASSRYWPVILPRNHGDSEPFGFEMIEMGVRFKRILGWKPFACLRTLLIQRFPTDTRVVIQMQFVILGQ